MDRFVRLSIPTFAVVLALSFSIGAAEGQEPQQNMKMRLIEHIDAKIRILQTAKDCVRAAADMKAMAICHEQERKQTKDLKKQSRASIQERKVQRPERKGPPSGPAAK